MQMHDLSAQNLRRVHRSKNLFRLLASMARSGRHWLPPLFHLLTASVRLLTRSFKKILCWSL